MWTRACVPRRLDDFSGPQPALFSFALPEAPTFVLADLTYTSCSPSAILFLPGRAVHGRKHGRMPPHMGQTMADTRGPCPLFARSCFDEVGPRPHNAVTFFSVPFFLSFFSFSRYLSVGLLFVVSLPLTICFDSWISRLRPQSLNVPSLKNPTKSVMNDFVQTSINFIDD